MNTVLFESTVEPDRPDLEPEPEPAAPSAGRGNWLGWTLPVVAAVLWLVSLGRSDLSTVSIYGLLASVDPTYSVALVLTLLGFALELHRPIPRRMVLGLLGVVLLLIMHATTAVLLPEPEYAWTYKHLGVIEYFQSVGEVRDSEDIYQQWPVFFTAVAQFCSLTGVEPLSLAPWEPLFVNLAYSLVLLAVFRSLTSNRRRAVAATLLFACVNWTGQYLSPQDFGYLLSLGILLVVLRWLRKAPVVPRKFRLLAIVSMYLLFAVLAASHQLSPYLVLLDIGVLGILGYLRPWYLAAGLAVVAIGYLAPREAFVASNYGPILGGDFLSNGAGTAAGWGSDAQAFSALCVRGLSAALWGASVVAAVVARRQIGKLAIPLLLTFAPFCLLFAQSYGGEAIYRVYLFSAPWAAYTLSWLLPRLRHRLRLPTGLSIAVSAVGLSGMAAIALQGSHGQLYVDQSTTGEVQASTYFYDHAAARSGLVLAAQSFPARLTANYDAFNRGGDPDLLTGLQWSHDEQLGADDLPQVEAFVRQKAGTRAGYLVFSHGMRQYVEYFGYLRPEALPSLERAIGASPRWRVFHRTDDTTIFQLIAPPSR